MTAQDWLTIGLAVATPAGPVLTWLLTGRGRRAAASRDEADAIESLTASVAAQARQIDEQRRRIEQVVASLWDAHRQLRAAEERAIAAEQRAAAAELRAATYEAELVAVRADLREVRERPVPPPTSAPPAAA